MDLPARLERDGVWICSGVVPGETVVELRSHFAGSSGRPGARGFALGDDAIQLLSSSGSLGSLAAQAAGVGARPVRVLFFDKTAETNWAVPWHQDRTIAVNRRIEIDGYWPWSRKDGVDHVEPPLSVLASMLTLRLFLDDCGKDDGPLEVALGSHRRGRIAAADLAEVVGQSAVFVGAGQAGDVLVMKALAIHRSKRAVVPAHRRVLHVDYAMADLPSPLAWKLN
jgi:hypothetical protein